MLDSLTSLSDPNVFVPVQFVHNNRRDSQLSVSTEAFSNQSDISDIEEDSDDESSVRVNKLANGLFDVSIYYTVHCTLNGFDELNQDLEMIWSKSNELSQTEQTREEFRAALEKIHLKLGLKKFHSSIKELWKNYLQSHISPFQNMKWDRNFTDFALQSIEMRDPAPTLWDTISGLWKRAISQ